MSAEATVAPAVDIVPLSSRAMSSDDPEALRRTRYEGIQREHGASLARVVGSYARTKAEREDLVQELALAIWRALPSFRGDASLRTFCFRIAHNCAISHLRRRKHRQHDPERELVDERDSALELMERRCERELLLAAIAALPMGLRQVLVLQLEGMSYLQIAEVVGISEKNVSVRLSRARAQLRTRLGEMK